MMANGSAIRIGDTIRAARLAQGLTQADLSKILDVNSNTLSKWENGYSEPDPERLGHLATVLKLPALAEHAPAPTQVEEPVPSTEAEHWIELSHNGLSFRAGSSDRAWLSEQLDKVIRLAKQGAE